MENQNLRIINSLGAANKKKLLKTFEHKTINDAIKHYTNINKRKYTEEEKLNTFRLMQDEYNDVVRNLQQQAKENKKQIKS